MKHQHQMRWPSLRQKIKHNKCVAQLRGQGDIKTQDLTKKWKKAAEKVVANDIQVAILDKMMLARAVLIKEAHKQKKEAPSTGQVHFLRPRNNRVHHPLCRNP